VSPVSERLWSDTDRELAANAYHWAASRHCGPDNCPGTAECCHAESLFMGGFSAVLDALIAAGWRGGFRPGCTCPTAGVMVQPGCEPCNRADVAGGERGE